MLSMRDKKVKMCCIGHLCFYNIFLQENIPIIPKDLFHNIKTNNQLFIIQYGANQAQLLK